MLIDKRSLDILPAASKDTTRPSITVIHVREDGTLEATNGEIIARVGPCPIAPEDAPLTVTGGTQREDDTSIIENANHLPSIAGKSLVAADLVPVAKALAGVQKTGRHLPPVLSCAGLSTSGDKWVHAKVTNLDTVSDLTVRVGESQFPDTDRYYTPDTSPVVVRFGLAPKYLKMLADMTGDGHAVCFEIQASSLVKKTVETEAVSGPIHFTCGDDSRPITGVIMPIRP